MEILELFIIFLGQEGVIEKLVTRPLLLCCFANIFCESGVQLSYFGFLCDFYDMLYHAEQKFVPLKYYLPVLVKTECCIFWIAYNIFTTLLCFFKVASSALGFGPQMAMQIAERLYTQGYIRLLTSFYLTCFKNLAASLFYNAIKLYARFQVYLLINIQ